MTTGKIIALMGIAGLALVSTGCASTSKTLGLKQSAPNEFNIMTKAPLIMPPDYNLRPPRVGESSVYENYSQQAAREALIGDIDSVAPSQGEIALMNKAKVAAANPEIRMIIDGQNGVERKTAGFSDRVIFWNNGQPMQAESALTPEQEAARLESITKATGGGEVIITRRPGGGKLPGL